MFFLVIHMTRSPLLLAIATKEDMDVKLVVSRGVYVLNNWVLQPCKELCKPRNSL